MLIPPARLLILLVAISLATLPLVAEDEFFVVGNDALYQVDPDGPDHRLLGPIGTSVSAIAGYDGGLLFAADSAGDRLVLIDRFTGSGSVVGAFGDDFDILDLAFDELGSLWAIGCQTGPDCPTLVLKIDPNSGTVEPGSAILSSPPPTTLAIIGGVFYVGGPSTNLGVLDPLTGEVTAIRPSPDPCIGTRGAANASDGTLWAGVHNFCSVAPIEPWSLLQLDPQTGDVVGTGALQNRTALPFFGILGPAILPVASNPPSAVFDVRAADAARPLALDVTYARQACFDQAEVSVSGDRIDILAREICGCQGGPAPGMFSIEVGPLAIGRYRVRLERQGFADGIACDARTLEGSTNVTIATSTLVNAIAVQPPVPNEEDDVSLLVDLDCPTTIEVESVVDRIVWLRAGPPNLPDPTCSVPSIATLPLGKLPAGSHTVIVRGQGDNQDSFSGLSRFEVLDLGRPAVVLAARYQVEATWTRPDGSGGVARGRLIRGSDIAAELSFANPSNPELLVKLLDGCGNNGHRWLFAGGLTNLGVVLTITDLSTGEALTFENPVGQRFAPILDTQAYVCN